MESIAKRNGSPVLQCGHPQGSSFDAGRPSIRDCSSPVARAARRTNGRLQARPRSFEQGAEMSRTKLRRYFRHGLFPQMLVFEAVARLGSVTRAAEELHLAQPTVSIQLKKLAAALAVTLFEQRGRQLHLTAAGYALRETCAELTALLERADERLAAWRDPHGGTLRLAAEPEARQVATRLIAAFCARHPGVLVSLQLAERAELLARFARGADDVYLFALEI